MTLDTKWFEVKGCRITNNRIRKKLFLLTLLEIKLLQERYIKNNPCYSIIYRSQKIRSQGKQNNTIQYSFMNEISKTISNVDKFESVHN